MEDNNITQVIVHLIDYLNIIRGLIQFPEGDPLQVCARVREQDRRENYEWFQRALEILGPYGPTFEGICQQRADEGKGPTLSMIDLKPVLEQFRQLLNSENYIKSKFVIWEDLGPFIDAWLRSLSLFDKANEQSGNCGDQIDERAGMLNWLNKQEKFQKGVHDGDITDDGVWKNNSISDLVFWLDRWDLIPHRGGGSQRDWKSLNNVFRLANGSRVTSQELSDTYHKY